MDFKHVPLQDLCVSITDCPHSTPKWTDAGKIVIRNQNIKNGRLDLSMPSFTNQEDFDKRVVRAKPVAGDIIITREAPMGEVCRVPEGVECCLGQRMVLLKPNYSVVDGDYLLYVLMSREVQFQISWSEGTGTTVSNLRIPHLCQLSIPYVEIEQQKKIASILATLDKRIENKNKINNNLSTQIKTLCESWFGDHSAFGSECPENWSLTPLSHIAAFVGGYSYKGTELVESDIGMATIKNFNRIGGFKLEGYKEIKPSSKLREEQHVELFDTLVAHTDLTQNAEVIGNAEPVLSLAGYKDVVFSMDLVKVLPINPNISKFLIAGMLKTARFKSHCMGYVNGTTVLHLSKKALQDYEIILPNDYSQLKEIDEAVTSMYKQMANNVNECRILEQMRDLLLSGLFSGEIHTN